MTAQTTCVVTYCAVCDALETMHEIRADGSRGKRYGVSASSVRSATGGTAPHDPCPGYEPGRTEERPPEEELRRRLLDIRGMQLPPALDYMDDVRGSAWRTGYVQALSAAARIARGEAP